MTLFTKVTDLLKERCRRRRGVSDGGIIRKRHRRAASGWAVAKIFTPRRGT